MHPLSNREAKLLSLHCKLVLLEPQLTTRSRALHRDTGCESECRGAEPAVTTELMNSFTKSLQAAGG